MQKLPDAELHVMLSVWKHNRPVTARELLEDLEDKTWHIATLNKLLQRLKERGFLNEARSSRPKLYEAKIPEKRYKRWEGRQLLDTLYQGSLHNLVASLVDDSEPISDEELAALERLISEQKEVK